MLKNVMTFFLLWSVKEDILKYVTLSVVIIIIIISTRQGGQMLFWTTMTLLLCGKKLFIQVLNNEGE